MVSWVQRWKFKLSAVTIPSLIHLLVIIGFGHVEFVEICTRELESAADGIKGSCTEIVVQGTDVQRIWKLSECIGVWSKMGRNASEQEGYTTQDSE